MSRHLSLGFFISLLFHGIGVCSIAFIGVLLPDTSPSLVIDFLIEKPCTDCPPPNSPKTHAEASPEKIEKQPEIQQTETLLASIPEPVEDSSLKQVEVQKQQIEKPEAVQSLPHKISPVKVKKRLLSEEEVRLAKVEAIPEPVLDNAPNEAIESKDTPIESIAATQPAIEHSVSEEKSVVNADNVQATPVSLQNQYLKAHFSYIKDAVQLKTSYPTMARKMGWEGQVLLSFVISTNGYVEAIQIIKSCGFKALDQNAIKTVRQCAPFPKPLSRAKLTLPITYRLN